MKTGEDKTVWRDLLWALRIGPAVIVGAAALAVLALALALGPIAYVDTEFIHLWDGWWELLLPAAQHAIAALTWAIAWLLGWVLVPECVRAAMTEEAR